MVGNQAASPRGSIVEEDDEKRDQLDTGNICETRLRRLLGVSSCVKYPSPTIHPG